MTRKAPVAPIPPPSNSATSLKMVAIEAGVSSSTVSRFLNGTAKVNGPKRVAIEAAIRKLKFVPDPMASGLAGGKSRCVGVITQALDSPFYGQGLLGIEDVLLASNYAPLFMSGHWREDDERRCIASLQGRRVDGIIILTPCLPDAALL
jgi:LacI family transcriptional regulator